MPTSDAVQPPTGFEPIVVGEVSVRRLRPISRRPSEQPRWEVSMSGTPIGWIDRHLLRGAAADFYFATGVHPGTGAVYRLEGSTDFAERVEKVADFHRDPTSRRQHLGISSWAEAAKAGTG